MNSLNNLVLYHNSGNYYPTNIFLKKISKIVKFVMYMILLNISCFFCLAIKPLWNFIESRLHVNLVVTDVGLMFGQQKGDHNYDVLKRLIVIAKLCISKFKY